MTAFIQNLLFKRLWMLLKHDFRISGSIFRTRVEWILWQRSRSNGRRRVTNYVEEERWFSRQISIQRQHLIERHHFVFLFGISFLSILLSLSSPFWLDFYQEILMPILFERERIKKQTYSSSLSVLFLLFCISLEKKEEKFFVRWFFSCSSISFIFLHLFNIPLSFSLFFSLFRSIKDTPEAVLELLLCFVFVVLIKERLEGDNNDVMSLILSPDSYILCRHFDPSFFFRNPILIFS